MKQIIFFLRISLGWIFFYAGITKVIDPTWTAAGYLNNTDSFSGLFSWFASPENIGWVNSINEWGLTLVGLALIFGLWTKYASMVGIGFMVLYYLPILDFPKVGEHSFLIDEHVIYILILWLFIATDAGKYKGLDGRKVK